MATVGVRTPNSMPGSYFDTKHSAGYNLHEPLHSPLAPSSRPRLAHSPSHHRSRSNRSISSIPRPVSRSDKDSEGVRKRQRLDNYSYVSRSTASSAQSTPRVESHHKRYGCGLDGESEYDLSYFSAADSVRTRDPTSPPPFINTTYRLAGGLDTPGASFERQQQEWADREEELDWRVNRFTKSDASTVATPSVRRRNAPRTPSSTSINGQKRSLEDSPVFETPVETQRIADATYTASGWHIRSRAWAMTGGLAYKAINFCLSTAFRGFSAGGGQSYAMDIGTPEVPHRGLRVSQIGANEDVFSNKYEPHEDVPGGFPEDELSYDDISSKVHKLGMDRDHSTPTLQGQVDDHDFQLKNDWLMVDRPGTARRRSRASIAGSRSNSYRNSRSNVVAATGASFASPRPRPSMGHSRRASRTLGISSPDRNHSSLAIDQPFDIPQTVHMSPTARKSIQPSSPLPISPDVAKFEKRMRKKARQEDESMSRMNAHLQDLIRQGKEALGSKIIVEDEDDEGFYEDGSDNEQRFRSRQAW